MSFDLTKTFDVNNGVTLSEGGSAIVSSTGSPVGQAAPVGTYYHQSDGPAIWEKYGALDSEWRTVVGHAVSFPRIPILSILNSQVSNGTWITYSNLTPNSRIVVPVASILQEVTWSTPTSNVSFDMTFRRNGRTATIFHTEELRNATGGGSFYPTEQSFVQDDFLDVQYVDQGTNAQDLVTVFFFQAVEM